MSTLTVPFKVGNTFYHRELGECQLRKIHSNGDLTVCTTDIPKGSNTNIFRLVRPMHPGYWVVTREVG